MAVLLASALLGMLFLGWNLLQNKNPGLSRYEVSSELVPGPFDGYRILQLSDLHEKEFGPENERIVKIAESASPDLIVMTGDMASRGDRSFEAFFSLAQRLTKRCPVFYILGNHEQGLYRSDLKALLDGLAARGVNLLQNEKISLTREGKSVELYGFAPSLSFYHNPPPLGPPTRETVQAALGSPARDRFCILLAHNPLWFEAYAKWGADLTFSGHVHGGMIRLPIIGGVFSPERKLFPSYHAGAYEIDGKQLIVSRGLSGNPIDFRILNPPDLVLVTLKTK